MRYLRTLLILSLLIYSCSKNVDEPIVQEEEYSTYTMEFVGQVNGYEGVIAKSSVPTRADASDAWYRDDVLYISFYVGDRIVPGMAKYDEISKSWGVTPYGNLTIGDKQRCEVRYFGNGNNYGQIFLRITPNTPIYEDVSATYSVKNDKQIVLNATLNPKTARIRFKRQLGTSEYIGIGGVKIYSGFDTSTGRFFETPDYFYPAVMNIDQDYTDYFYCDISEDNNRLYLSTSHPHIVFTRVLNPKVVKPGFSGYMAVPSLESHNNWIKGISCEVAGVEFLMLPTDYNDWYLGETEVTEELYQTVYGNPSSSQLPQTNITREEAKAFANKLSSLLHLDFYIPEWYIEWEALARTSVFTDINHLDSMVWYSGNCSSIQPVKTKMPDSRGFYDLNGNAAEWTTSYDGLYLFCGGSWRKSSYFFYTYEEDCEPTSDPDYKSDDVGFRLCVRAEWMY